MIAKFKLDDREWIIKDDVVNIRYKNITRTEKNDIGVEATTDLVIDDFDRDPKPEEHVVVDLEFQDSTFRLTTCRPFYLLNDEGKTIEKIK